MTTIFSRKDETINEIVSSLEQEFILTDEGDIEALLGISTNKAEEGEKKLNQPFRTNKSN